VTYFRPDLPGYFEDYINENTLYPVNRIAEVLRKGYGQHYSKFLQKEVGKNIPASAPVNSLVMPLSNIDQVANYFGLRLNQRLSFEAYKAVAALTLLLPGPPFFLCGDESYSQDPVFFFCDHSDPVVIEGTRKGRFEELRYFYSDPNQLPDPLDVRTFLKSRQHLDVCGSKQKAVLDLFRKCLSIRKQVGSITITDRDAQKVLEFPNSSLIQYTRTYGGETAILLLNLGSKTETVDIQYPAQLYCLLNTRSTEWSGPGISAEPINLSNISVGPESLMLLIGHMSVPEEFYPIN
jgi:1,4-alpha-glucan branching enzyme